MSNWIEVGKIEDIPALGARVVKNGDVDIAVFRNNKDEVLRLMMSVRIVKGNYHRA